MKNLNDLENNFKTIISMVSFEGFNSCVLAFFSEGLTMLQAFRKSNDIYEKHFGQKKYSCYESFAVCRKRNRDKKHKKCL